MHVYSDDLCLIEEAEYWITIEQRNAVIPILIAETSPSAAR